MNGSRLTVYDMIKDKHHQLTNRQLTLVENVAACKVVSSEMAGVADDDLLAHQPVSLALLRRSLEVLFT